MEQVDDPRHWRSQLEERRRANLTVGLVPTMGALHQGHLSLIDAVREAGANSVTVSIFVNPTQFNDSEDLLAYPRQLERDLDACRSAGVDLVFVPGVDEMHQVLGSTQVLPPQDLASRLEGVHRPGHFTGMATVVAKLLILAGQCVAAFGKKDYQQLSIIRRLQHDLLLDAHIVAVETVREPSGLACSSRNARLSRFGRQRASALRKGLVRARKAYANGLVQPDALRKLVTDAIAEYFDLIDYVEVVHGDSLRPFEQSIADDGVILCAASLEGIRLIDNIELDPRVP